MCSLQSNYTVDRENVAIDVRGIISRNESVILGDTRRINGSETTSSSIRLTMDLLDEARTRSQDDIIQVNSVLYRQPSFFRSATDNEPVTSLFGEGPARQIWSSVLGDVIAVDLSSVEMKNLRTPVVINHLIPFSKARLGAQNFTDILRTNASAGSESSDKYAEETMRKVPLIRCVFWDFSLNQNSGGWSDDGCELYENATTNDVINATCMCDHMTNFGIILVS